MRRSFWAALRVGALAAGLGFALSGCAMVGDILPGGGDEAPAPEPVKIASIRVAHGQDLVPVDDTQISLFQGELNRALHDKDRFTEGDQMTAEFRFIQYEREQAIKHLVSFGQRKGNMKVEVRYLDPSGLERGEIEVDGEVLMGLFDASTNGATRKAAERAAEYAADTFK